MRAILSVIFIFINVCSCSSLFKTDDPVVKLKLDTDLFSTNLPLNWEKSKDELVNLSLINKIDHTIFYIDSNCPATTNIINDFSEVEKIHEDFFLNKFNQKLNRQVIKAKYLGHERFLLISTYETPKCAVDFILITSKHEQLEFYKTQYEDFINMVNIN